ncbi:hypothetical protein HPB50_016573 [Hyalomma asiaticum]|uniref:Uncharacterized protein n=1 Tax=Hyalomma asiaticum TaxID=266040 RepID=A0ACB7T2W1_HYAAI|nr:hypothetical protein HPB50_016573 [Hyalomma asiaticum]
MAAHCVATAHGPQQVGDNRMRGSVVREARAAAAAARGTEEGGGGPTERARPAAADARPSTHMVPGGGAHLFKRQEEGEDRCDTGAPAAGRWCRQLPEAPSRGKRLDQPPHPPFRSPSQPQSDGAWSALATSPVTSAKDDFTRRAGPRAGATRNDSPGPQRTFLCRGREK